LATHAVRLTKPPDVRLPESYLGVMLYSACYLLLAVIIANSYNHIYTNVITECPSPNYNYTTSSYCKLADK